VSKSKSVSARGVSTARRGGGEEGRRRIGGEPLGRFGVPGDIVPAVAFLASVEAAWIAGETLRVAGGVR
jgi:3-oxoacyl-[acyl-carrier protein] reductase